MGLQAFPRVVRLPHVPDAFGAGIKQGVDEGHDSFYTHHRDLFSTVKLKPELV